MAIAVDLVVDDGASTLCDGVGLDHNHIYKDKPKKCPECCSVRFRSYEILGSIPEPIIWECKRCQSRFAKYPLEEMEDLLKQVVGLWTIPDDWGKVAKGDYN